MTRTRERWRQIRQRHNVFWACLMITPDWIIVVGGAIIGQILAEWWRP